MNRTRVFIICAGVLALSACVRRPAGVAGDKEMVSVVADMELAEAWLQNNPQGASTEEKKRQLMEYVLQSHGMTQAEFDSTMAWYGRNVDQYQMLYAKVDRELAKRKKKYTGSATQESTSDLWPYSRMGAVTELSDADAFNFSVPASGIAEGSRIEWRMRLASSTTGTALLGVEYDNGTFGYLHRSLSSSKRIALTLQTDTARSVRRIFGNLLVPTARDLPLWLDSISLRALPYDSLEYYNLHGQRTWRGPMPKPKPVEKKDSVPADSLKKAESLKKETPL